MPVITSLELDNLVAAGDAPCKTHGAHGGFGAGIHQADLVDSRNHPHHQLGQARLSLGRRPETGSPPGGRGNGFDHLGVRVAEDQRSPGGETVDIFPAGRVPYPAPESIGDKKGRPAHRPESPHRGIHAAGNYFFRLLEQLFVRIHFISPRNNSAQIFTRILSGPGPARPDSDPDSAFGPAGGLRGRRRNSAESRADSAPTMPSRRPPGSRRSSRYPAGPSPWNQPEISANLRAK